MTDTVDKVIIQAETQGVQQSTDQVNKLGQSMEGISVASQNVEKSTASVEGKFAALERRFSTTAGNAAQLEKVQRTVNQAIAQNPELQDRANAVLAAATSRYGAAAVEAEHFSGQSQALLHSIRSVGEQLALGVPITQAATGQLSHLSYVATGEGGLTGAFGQIASKVGGATTALAAAVSPAIALTAAIAATSAGAIALGVSWQKGQDDIERSLANLGRFSGATVSDINAVAAAVSNTSKLSIGQASDIAVSFAATGKIGKDVLQPATAAVDGLAKALGTDAADAAKVLATALADPARGVEELDAKIGGFNNQMQEAIAQAVRMGDVQQAQALIIQQVTAATQGAVKANESWADSFSSVWKNIKDGATLLGSDIAKTAQVGRYFVTGEIPSSLSKQDQLSVAQSDLSSFQQSLPGNLAANAGDPQAIQAIYDAYAKLLDKVKELKDAATAEGLAAWNKQLDDMAKKADAATNAVLPQIEQIKKLDAAISDLTRAQNVTDVSGRQNNGGYNEGALTVYQQQKELLQEGLDKQIRQAQVIGQIKDAWGGVSSETAVTLNNLQSQLPVISASSNAVRMEAQYYATISQLTAKGVSQTEAIAIAQQQYVNSQAAAVAGANQQTAALRDQNELAAAAVGYQGSAALYRQQEVAAGQAYNNVLKDTNSAEAASARASEVSYSYQLRINQALEQEYQARQQALRVQQAQADAEVRAATAAEEQARAASSFRRAADYDPNNPSFGSFSVPTGSQYQLSKSPPYFGPSPLTPNSQLQGIAVNQAYQTGGIDAAIRAAVSSAKSGGVFGIPGSGPDYSALFSNLSTLYDLKNAQTSDKAVQAANIRDEIALIQTLPETIARDQQLATLVQSLNSLTSSTDSLNSTMSDALSPYYSQDPRTSHIGFRTQGMATGGEFTVPGGYSANDNMLAQIPVASGEVVSVRRPGQGSAGNTTTVTVSPTIVIQGNADQQAIDAMGRTVYQNAQAAIKQFGAATR